MAQLDIHTQHAYQMRIENETERLIRIGKAWNAYDGSFNSPLKIERTPDGQAGPDDNVIVNLVRPAVDRHVNALFGRELDIDAGERDEAIDGQPGSEDTAEEGWLDTAWPEERREIDLQRMAHQGALTGHVFVKIVPGVRFVNSGNPRIVVLDTGLVTKKTDPNDTELIHSYTIQYESEVDHRAAMVRQIVRPIDTAATRAWEITDQYRWLDSSVWVTTNLTPWPFEWSPILDVQNLPSSGIYGSPDITADLIALNESINRVLSSAQRGGRYHAHSLLATDGLDPRQAAAIDMRPGGLVNLPEGKKLDVLQPSYDFDGALSFYRALREMFHKGAAAPDITKETISGLGAISGAALRWLHIDLIDRVETKRRLYESLIVDICQHLLELGGFGPDVDIDVTWPDVLQADALEERQIAVIDKSLGVSDDTILTGLGYDAENEAEKRATQAASAGAPGATNANPAADSSPIGVDAVHAVLDRMGIAPHPASLS